MAAPEVNLKDALKAAQTETNSSKDFATVVQKTANDLRELSRSLENRKKMIGDEDDGYEKLRWILRLAEGPEGPGHTDFDSGEVLLKPLPSDPLRQIAACAAMRNISISEENRACLVQDVHVFGRITALIMVTPKGDEWVEMLKHLAGMLRNASINADNKVTVVNNRGMECLSKLKDVDDDETRKHVAACIRYLARSDDNHYNMIHRGDACAILKKMVQKGQDDVQTMQHCAAAYRYLSRNDGNEARMGEEWALNMLITVLKIEGADGPDGETQRHAAGALRNLSVDENNKKTIMNPSEGGLQQLFNVCEITKDPETKRHIAATLRNLSIDDTNESTIAETAVEERTGLKIIIDLSVKEEDAETKRHAAASLRNLSFDPKHKEAIMEQCDSIQDILDLCGSTDLETQRHAAGLVRNLSFDEKNQQQMVAKGELMSLLMLSRSSDAETQQHAQCALRNLSVNALPVQYVFKKGSNNFQGFEKGGKASARKSK